MTPHELTDDERADIAAAWGAATPDALYAVFGEYIAAHRLEAVVMADLEREGRP